MWISSVPNLYRNHSDMYLLDCENVTQFYLRQLVPVVRSIIIHDHHWSNISDIQILDIYGDEHNNQVKQLIHLNTTIVTNNVLLGI